MTSFVDIKSQELKISPFPPTFHSSSPKLQNIQMQFLTTTCSLINCKHVQSYVQKFLVTSKNMRRLLPKNYFYRMGCKYFVSRRVRNRISSSATSRKCYFGNL